jgi:hypothetical protein
MRDDPGSRHNVVERRFHGYILMTVIVLPRVLFSGAINDGAAVLLVWSAIGLALTRARTHRIPRAILWRPRETRLRKSGDALLERPGAPDPGNSRDLGEDLSAHASRAIQS